MKTHLAAGLALVTLLAVGGCGDRTATGDTTAGAGTTAGDDTTQIPPADTFEHPTGADEVVLRIITGGGFVPPSYAFTNQPTLLLLGDGRVVLPDATAPQAEGHRLEGLHVVQADETTVQQLLALADEHGLLQEPPTYDDLDSTLVSDAPTTIVNVSADGQTWDHAAYALDIYDDQTETGTRAELADFITQATDLVADAPSTPYVPNELRLYVEPLGGEPDGRSSVVDWPASDGGDAVDLAEAKGCIAVPAADLVEALSDADFSTYFRQDGAVYEVSAAASLPGESGCSAGF